MRVSYAVLPALAAAANWSNWDGHQTCSPAKIVSVSSEADVVAAVTAAARANQTVKAPGFGHSFSGIALENGVLLNLVAPAQGAIQQLSATTVRTHAAVHLWELSGQLEHWNLSLPNLGAISNQTVAGATSTNTHGTGPTGGLSTFIIGARVVLANGTAITASATENPEVFRFLRTGYGALGVLVTLDLAVWPLWTMEQIVAPYDLGDLMKALPALLTQYDRLQWYFTPYTTNATLLIRANTTAPITGCWNPIGPAPNAPVTPPPRGMAVWPAGTRSCVDLSYKTLTHNGDDVQRYTEMEMMVPAGSHLDIINDLLEYQQKVLPFHNPAVQLFTGVRYVTGDDIPLSPFYARDTAVVSMIVFGNDTAGGPEAEVQLYDLGLQAMAAANYSGRPHPGKWNTFNATMMRAAYPDTYDAFVALRGELDPAGTFSNAYLQALFGVVEAAVARYSDVPQLDVYKALTGHESAATALHYQLKDGGVTTFSFADMQRAAGAMADELAALGVGKGDRVAVMLHKCPELVATGLAIWKLGAVYVPLFTAFGPDAIAYRAHDAGVKVIVTDAVDAGKVEELPPSVRSTLNVLTVVPPGQHLPLAMQRKHIEFNIESLLRASGPPAAPGVVSAGTPVSPHDAIVLLYTSGTTGQPKGVDIPARSLASFEAYLRLGVGLQPQVASTASSGRAREQRYFCSADPGWAYGMYYNLLGPLAMGEAPLYLESNFTADTALHALANHCITHYASAPTAYRVIKAAGDAVVAKHRERIAAQLETCSSAGEPLNPEVLHWWQRTFGLPIADHYGQTETGMLINNHWADRAAGASWIAAGSMGRSMPGIRAVVVNAAGHEVVGSPGEVAIDTASSPLLWFRGYYKNEHKTLERFVGAPVADPTQPGGGPRLPQHHGRFYLTGDVATHEITAGALGGERFWFRSRADDVITSSGYRIGPFEVESSLMKSPHVAEVAVVGLADPEGLRGEIVAAFVVLKGVAKTWGDLDKRALGVELQRLVKHDLSAHEYPRYVEFVEALPKTPSGKVQRFVLKSREPSVHAVTGSA